MSDTNPLNQTGADLRHDIKNHLTVIQSYADLIELWEKGEMKDKEKLQKCIEIIKKRVQVLTHLVDQIPNDI